jgi:MATE family multidrug resistance protein
LLWSERPFQALLRLAWPIAVSTVSFSVMTLVDTVFVGRLGSAALGGVGLGGVAAFTVICFGIGLLRSVKVLTSQAVGAGQHEQTNAYVGGGLLLAAGLGVTFAFAGTLLAPELVRLTDSSATAAAACSYFELRILGAPVVLTGIALREARYGVSDSRSPMRAALIANLLHIPLNWALIFALDLGVPGAAMATLAAQAVELCLLAFAQRAHGFGLNAVRLEHVKRLWRLGLPIGAEFVMSVTAFAALVAIIARMSEADLAAHQIALQLTQFSFLPAVAIGEAASVLTGQAVGANADRLVRRVARAALQLAGAYTALCALVFASAGAVLVTLFTRDAGVQRLATHLLYVAAAFQVFDAAQVVARSILRGAGDVRYSACVAVASAWLLGAPTAAWLGLGLSLGAVGAWSGLGLEIAVAALILWWRVHRERWKPAAERARNALTRVMPRTA